MVYTEIKQRNKRKYYYRVLSVRRGKKVLKKRVYLGMNLDKKQLVEKESEADNQLMPRKKYPKAIESIIPKITKILKKNKVERAGIFGSYARGEQKKGSDIDILVEIGDKKMSLLGFVSLMRLLEDSISKKVDLVEYSAIKPQIKDSILKEELRII
ncbi:nucleotidyltransferase domain protein [archaeon BMS3Abin17]|nr:nucleotidyltransferase domain protein [archaeon BMS3Abin17]